MSHRPLGPRSRGRSGPPERGPLAEAVRMLARRPLTCAEVRTRLLDRGHDEAGVEDAIERLGTIGALDDAALARHWVEVRSARKGHGPRRLLRDLEARGVDASTARRAIDEAIDSDGLDLGAVLRREAEKRVRGLGSRRDRRAYARVYTALLRAGFESGEIHEALTTHFSGSGEPRNDAREGTGIHDHDLE